MTEATIALETIDDYIASIEAMRSPDVTSANTATKWARLTFTKLMETNDDGLHPFTVDMAVIAVCEVYKPKSAKGKRVNTIGALKLSGFPAISARLTIVKRIADNLGVAGVKPLVEAFTVSDKVTDSFAKLDLDVKLAVKEATPKPIASDAAGDDADTSTDITFSDTSTLADILNHAIGKLGEASKDDYHSVQAQLAELSTMIDLINLGLVETLESAAA